MTDLRTSAWLDDMFIYCGANVYGPKQLKEEIETSSEWTTRFRENFDHVLANRSLTALDYEKRTDIDFDSNEELFAFLERLHAYLFAEGPYPDWE